MGHDRLHRHQRGAHVDGKHDVDLGRVGLLDEPGAVDGGVVHQHVDAPEPFRGRAHEASHRHGVPHVELPRLGISTSVA